MSEDKTQIIKNQEAITSLNDLNKQKEYFSVIPNFKAGESLAKNSLVVISNIDGDILFLVEKLISLGVCNYNGLSFYEFEEQKFISEEELTQLIAVREIANKDVENNFNRVINNFFMLPDLDKIKINITEKIKKQIERLNQQFLTTFEENNDELIFTQMIGNNEYKIIISKESNPSNMDFFCNGICILQDEMPENLSNLLVNRIYPPKFLNKISDILNRSQHSFYVLPDLKINLNFNEKIIFSGNTINDHESIILLLILMKLVEENQNIKFLIGPQEIITKDTPQNTSFILRKFVVNNMLSTGIIMQDNSFSYNIFLPSYLPQLFEILQALRNENSDLPNEYRESWQIQFDKLSPDLKTKINLEIPFIKKNDKSNRKKSYIYRNGNDLHLYLGGQGFTDEDLIELKNAIGNIFFDLSYLDERAIEKYFSKKGVYNNWLFGEINSISDEYFLDINQNISNTKTLEIFYKVTQTEIDIDNQTKIITLSTGEIIGNESYSYQKFYKPELCPLFEILVKIYDEFVFLPIDTDRNKNYNTLFMIRDNQKYFEKLAAEQQNKVTLFCELIEERQSLDPNVNILVDNQFQQTLEDNFGKDYYMPLLNAYRNYPYQNYKEIFENQIAKFESLHNKLKSFLMNWEYYIETEHLDISTNYNVLYDKLITEYFSETELFEINFAVNNFFCDLVNMSNNVEKLFGKNFAAEIAQDFSNELMALKIKQNEISDANSQSELAKLDVDNFSVTQHIQENKFPKYPVIINNKQINIIPNFQLNFDRQNNLNESEKNESDKICETIILNNCENDTMFFRNLIKTLDELKSKNYLNEDRTLIVFNLCTEETITFANLTEILNICQSFLTFNIVNEIFSYYKIQDITFKNLLEIFEKCRSVLNHQLTSKIFDNYKNEISNIEDLEILFNNYHKNLNKDLTNKIFSLCKNNIFDNETLSLFLSKIQIDKINISKDNYHIFADKVLNFDNIIKLLNAGFLIEFPSKNDIPAETEYSEVIKPFFEKFDETIFTKLNTEQINNAIKNDIARTNFNNLCKLYHELCNDKLNEENKENENNNENNNPNNNEISDLNIKNENDSTNLNENENFFDDFSTFTKINNENNNLSYENKDDDDENKKKSDENKEDDDESKEKNVIIENNNENQDLNNDISNLSDENKDDENENKKKIESDIDENNNLDVTENTSDLNENDNKNTDKNELTNKNSTQKNFKLGIGLSIMFATLAIISGALIFLPGFFTCFVVLTSIFTIATIATSSKIADMFRIENAENKYNELKNKNLPNEEIEKQMPKDFVLLRKKWRDRFPKQQNKTNNKSL